MPRRRLPDGLALLATALWWGSLTVTAFITVPMLFAYMPTPALAGRMAAKLFTAQSWIALGCGMVLVLVARGREAQPRLDWADGALGFIAGGVLLALLTEFAVAPRIIARENLRLWHGVGSAMVLLQWICAGITLWKVTARVGAPRSGGDADDSNPGRPGFPPPRE